jgi:hypothetical protein
MSIEARLDRVERSLARTRLMNLGLLLGLTALVAGGADSVQDSITVRRLAIVDEHGAERVILSADQGGAAGMWVKDASDRVRLSSGVSSNNASYSQWFDANGRSRLAAMCSPTGESSIQWRDAEGNLRIGGATQTNGEATMMWIAPGNKPQIRVFTDKSGAAKFYTGD